MRMKLLLGAVLSVALVPATASAVLKAYDSTAIGGNDYILRAPNLSPTVIPTPGQLQYGNFVFDDDGAGTVTVDFFEFGSGNSTTTNLTGFAGPGSFIFTRNANTFKPAIGTFAGGVSGDTSPGGSGIDWGLLTGWSSSGGFFCNSSPPFVCTFAGRAEDMTIPGFIPSSTYDIGTWSFDSSGDFVATPYIDQTNNGGVGNSTYLLRGKLFGSTLPALPLLGFGALAVSLLVIGGRAVLKDK